MKRFSVLFVVSLVCSGITLTAAAQNRPELVAPASQVSKPQPTSGNSFVPTQAKPSSAAVSTPPSGSRGSVRASQASQTPRALLPLRPPRVNYTAGQLSIVAENSTLADVLNAVRQKTGAVIESPPSAARERVVISIGPAPANDVLTALLNGSKFDYIILGAQHGSGAPQHVILREQQSLPAGGGQPAQSAMTAPVRHLPPEAPEPMEEEEFVPEPEVTEEIQSEPAIDQHGQPQSEQQQPEQPQIKTPEQMLEELKRMQQQQLQQQQQQQGTQPQGNEQQQRQNQQQPQDQQQQPQTVPDSEPPIVND